MKKLIEIKSWLNNELLFSHECENNTIKITLELAVSLKINLRGSNLSGSDLSGSNLRYSNLSGSNLSGSNLSGSDLRGSNLSGSDLSGSNLRYSDLSGSNLSGSDLSYCLGNSKEIKTILCCKYKIIFTKDMLFIGCKSYLISEWKEFIDEEISRMDEGALEWWKKWKEFIFMAIELSKEE